MTDEELARDAHEVLRAIKDLQDMHKRKVISKNERQRLRSRLVVQLMKKGVWLRHTGFGNYEARRLSIEK